MVLLSSLPGIGPARLKTLEAHGITTVEGLLQYYPVRYEDTTTVTAFSAMESGKPCCVQGFVKKVSGVRAFGGRTMVTVTLQEDTGKTLSVVYFNQPWIAKQLQPGQEVCYWGTPTTDKRGHLNLVCPTLVKERGITPVYKPLDKLAGTTIRQLIKGALPSLEECCPETLPRSLRLDKKLCERNYALRQVHFPESAQARDIALKRIGFEEALMYYVALTRLRHERGQGIVIPAVQEDLDAFTAALPYAITGAQKRVLGEIMEDLASPTGMNRLVQGDVGSGKTVLAFAAVYFAARHGFQAAIMAPTEILARQHFDEAQKILEPLGVRCGLMTGGMKEADRKHALEALLNGECQCVIGTHALLKEDVRFKSLGLTVTDEQHRFGVRQRKALSRDRTGSADCNTLVMSATPIPRTLSLILYGDLDISVVDEMPPGRKPVRTRAVPEEKREQMYAFLIREAQKGRQAYIVCPFVEENETMDVKSAQEEYAFLAGGPLNKLRLGLTWGGQKDAEKQDTLKRFVAGKIDVLVSTTMIEVGVNVPNATVMVIENADRFGLATLHQLRGRVGRGAEESWCFLMAPETERIRMLCSTNDGFKIAEADLKMRGPGDFLGTRQHGHFEGIRLLSDGRVLSEIRECVEKMRSLPDQGDWEMIKSRAEEIYGPAASEVGMN